MLQPPTQNSGSFVLSDHITNFFTLMLGVSLVGPLTVFFFFTDLIVVSTLFFLRVDYFILPIFHWLSSATLSKAEINRKFEIISLFLLYCSVLLF